MTTEVWTAPIFFDLDSVESIAEEEAAVILDYTPPVILPEESEFETTAALLAHEPELLNEFENKTKHKQSAADIMRPLLAHSASKISTVTAWLLTSLGFLLVFMLINDTIQFISAQYNYSIVLGSVFLVLIISVLSASGIMIRQAYRNLLTVRKISALQMEGKVLLESNGHGDAIHYINRIAQVYMNRPDVKGRLNRFYGILSDSHQNQDICSLFSTYVMKDIDQQAYTIVAQRAKETALMVMFSPIPLVDVALTLWRNIKMIQDIATLYGGRPHFLGSLSLISSVIQNLIYADISEIVADNVAELFGNSMVSVLSAGAAQGLGSGMMTARVGLQAMQTCRPLPFAEDEKPRLKDIRWEIVSSFKKLFNAKEEKENN